MRKTLSKGQGSTGFSLLKPPSATALLPHSPGTVSPSARDTFFQVMCFLKITANVGVTLFHSGIVAHLFSDFLGFIVKLSGGNYFEPISFLRELKSRNLSVMKYHLPMPYY